MESSPLSNFRTYLSYQKETPYSIAPLIPFPSPRQPLIYFLSLQVCLLRTFPINRIIRWLSFYVWLLSFGTECSRFFPDGACVSTSLRDILACCIVWVYCISSIHSSVGRYLGYLHLWMVVNNYAVDMTVQGCDEKSTSLTADSS